MRNVDGHMIYLYNNYRIYKTRNIIFSYTQVLYVIRTNKGFPEKIAFVVMC